MTKAEYIAELKKRLSLLPPEDLRDALEYYQEYFAEAGEDNEKAVIAELGPPAYVAAQIIGRLTTDKAAVSEQTAKNNISMVWIIILGILASPIALPLAIVLIAVIFSLIIAAISIIFSLGIAVLAIGIQGIIVFILSFGLLFSNFPTALFFIGFGMTSFGVSCVLLLTSVWAIKFSTKMIAKLGNHFLARGR